MTEFIIGATAYAMINGRYYKTFNGKKTRIGKADFEAAQAEYVQIEADAVTETETTTETEAIVTEMETTETTEVETEDKPEPKKIRFIDSNYKTLFWLEDGKSIDIVDKDGNVETRECKYVDEHHVQVGLSFFHICQFAEIMEKHDKIYQPHKEYESTDTEEDTKEDKGNTKEDTKESKPEDKPKKRKSKDIAYVRMELTLTAKQVDFLKHLPDTDFWENGVESEIWVDCLCDEIGGQFENKPMTVGAMISTLCEKGLGVRCKQKVNNRKSTSFKLTGLGRIVATELGVE